MPVLPMVAALSLLAASDPTVPPGAWRAFLNSPSSDAEYRHLAERIERRRGAGRDESVAPSESEVDALVALVAQGEVRAVQAGFLALQVVAPGHLLEELYRALGAVADREPRLFLAAAREHRVMARRIVTMLSERVVDDDDRRSFEIRRRIRSLSSVEDADLAEERDAAVAELKNHEYEEAGRQERPSEPRAPQPRHEERNRPRSG